MERVRYLALTDIRKPRGIPFQEIDDVESLIRLLLYANEIQIEGIILCTSCYKHAIREGELRHVHRILKEYGRCLENLRRHADGYPSEEELHGKVKCGINAYGKSYGDGFGQEIYNDNEGVRHIINVLMEPDPSPLWIGLWGGANTLAQALWTMERIMEPSEFANALKKLRIYGISDQDQASIWMRETYGEQLFYIVSPSSGTAGGNSDGYSRATWPGISCDHFGHGSEDGVKKGGFSGAKDDLVSKRWLREKIRKPGGLGSLYPLPVFCMEGDSPSFMGLIANGLNEPEHPEYGGWGGRYVWKGGIWTDHQDKVLGCDRREHCSPQASYCGRTSLPLRCRSGEFCEF